MLTLQKVFLKYVKNIFLYISTYLTLNKWECAVNYLFSCFDYKLKNQWLNSHTPILQAAIYKQ